jgi:hypothetical protein
MSAARFELKKRGGRIEDEQQGSQVKPGNRHRVATFMGRMQHVSSR